MSFYRMKFEQVVCHLKNVLKWLLSIFPYEDILHYPLTDPRIFFYFFFKNKIAIKWNSNPGYKGKKIKKKKKTNHNPNKILLFINFLNIG